MKDFREQFVLFILIILSFPGYRVEKIEKIKPPKFVAGVFVNSTRNLPYKIEYYKKSGINTFVIDAHKLTYKDVMLIESNNIFLIARITVFPDGLTTFPAPEWMIKKATMLAQKCERIGVKTIQLDYIRFTDSSYYHNKNHVPEEQVVKDNYITKVIRDIKGSVYKNMRWQVDIFGRVPFVQYDRIGQNYELLDNEVDDICPMAYPSYFVKKGSRMNKEYNIIKQSSILAKKRAKRSKVILWIQGWREYNISHRNFNHFIYNQIAAAKEHGSDGFIVWNASSNYYALNQVMNTKTMLARLDN